MRRRTFPNLIGNVVEQQQRIETLEQIMRIVGFSPDRPYTQTVNDGTRNRVEIGKIGSDYGIKIVDNAGNEIILANGTIIANAIKSGTLDCDLITVANLSASVITTGTIDAGLIKAGTLNCSLITVSNLSAGSITVGTFASPNDRFTSGSLSGIKLSDGTITGNKLVAYTIKADNIDSNAITSDKISAGAVIASKISARTITADRIQVSSITTSEINYVSGSKLTSNSVTYDKISVTSLSAITATLGTVSSGIINGNTINAGYGGGGLNLYGNTFSIKTSGGSEVARFYAGIGSLNLDCSYSFNINTIINVEGIVVQNSFLAYENDKLKLLNNLDCNEYNIDACNTIWAYNFNNRCEFYSGDPFEVLKSFKPKIGKRSQRVVKMGEKWKDLDHDSLHKEIYEETTSDKKVIKGYSLNKIVELQRVAILQLKSEIEVLNKKINNL